MVADLSLRIGDFRYLYSAVRALGCRTLSVILLKEEFSGRR